MYDDFIKFVKNLYSSNEFIPLHEPRFIGNEKKYLNECIDSTYVSSVGKFVDKFEDLEDNVLMSSITLTKLFTRESKINTL